ncbi:hypothetical protein [Aureispira anguillae]|uniref:GIY-YIG domain-containing protein n=1 Tax=Aureispira anguillae TaxID=2864201 RepID=A0A915YG37_9BACT|nr:hypothetical protein [Aureispira anguillae]BDS12379.1 hypothetical protein AsAng_0031000 [Aureispira anguillae]
MNRQASNLTIHPPISSKLLGRYRKQKGVYVIRIKDQVIYIGISTNIYGAALRLFQKGGILSHIPVEKVSFEIIFSTLRRSSIEMVLKRHFKPVYNYIAQEPNSYTSYEKKQIKRIKDTYLKQSRFSNLGEHQSDS